ncbi:CesT family type III secretion system chaperone [Burkholderia sp. BCC1977]|uniref:CesT family type III secretion system chaperone n=1 Tax=Burkholderia sp. BCC1977 TaxID=2817440 RepID=UPI002ABDE153|nr:CesT family type III secretion system chaperone [Burkholderia sp. BCC1977]
MSSERFDAAIADLCDALALPDVDRVLKHRRIEIDGFDVALHAGRDHEDGDADDDALYLHMQYGIVTAGRTLTVFRLMLEANLSIYAQDQAQLGLDDATGGIVMIVRVPLDDQVTGDWLVDLLDHYVEHGRYWKNNIFASTDEMFDAIATGAYLWIRA